MQALDMEISRVRSLLRAEVERDISQKRAEAQRRQQDAEALKQELARARDRVDLSNKQKVELDQLKTPGGGGTRRSGTVPTAVRGSRSVGRAAAALWPM